MNTRKEQKRPIAFVSYAQSSRAWQERVLAFSTALRIAGGVDAEIDLYHGTDHQQWTTFGSNLIESSDFTLIAVDAAYKRRWLGQEKKGVGAGAAREAAAIRAIFERDQKDFLRRVKIVLLPGANQEDIPDDLLGMCERFVIEDFDESGLEKLLRTIWGKPAVEKPPLGDIPTLPPRFIARLERDSSADDPEQPEQSPKGGERPDTASAADARDEVALRDQLGQVDADLGDHSMAGPAKDDLLRERAALEMSLDTLAHARLKKRRGVRRQQRRVAGGQRISGGRATRSLLGLAVLAPIAALVLGMTEGHSPELERPMRAAWGGLELQGPPGWRKREGKANLAGLEIRKPVSLVPPPGSTERLQSAVVGISDVSGRTLLPAAYRAQLGEHTDRAPVDLGSLQAYRYTGLEAPGSSAPITVFVSPTSLGVATLACRSPLGEGDRTAPDPCTKIASTLRLSRGTAYPLGPSKAFSRALRTRLSRLSKQRQKALRKMDQAGDAGGQAAAAEDLADTFRDAAKGLATVHLTPESADARAAVVGALRSARDAYKALAVAARQENEGGYTAAAKAIDRAESLINSRLSALQRLGYRMHVSVPREVGRRRR